MPEYNVWKAIPTSHTVLATYHIVRLPSISREQFIDGLSSTVLPGVRSPESHRLHNIYAQELHYDFNDTDVDKCLWTICIDGVSIDVKNAQSEFGDFDERIRYYCNELYDSIKHELELLGVRTKYSYTISLNRWKI